MSLEVKDTIKYLLDDIEIKYNRLLEKKDRLTEENKHLKDEHYKDLEIQALQQKIDRLNKIVNCCGMRPEDYDKLLEWWREHSEKHKLCDWYIKVEDTAICRAYSIHCTKCDEHKTIFY